MSTCVVPGPQFESECCDSTAAAGNFLMSTGGWLCHRSLWSRRRKRCAHLYHETINRPEKTHLVMVLKWCTESDETRPLFIAIITQLRNICLWEIIEQSRCFTSRQWLLVTPVLPLRVWGTNKNAADNRDRREKLHSWLCQQKYCTQLIKNRSKIPKWLHVEWQKLFVQRFFLFYFQSSLDQPPLTIASLWMWLREKLRRSVNAECILARWMMEMCRVAIWARLLLSSKVNLQQES